MLFLYRVVDKGYWARFTGRLLVVVLALTVGEPLLVYVCASQRRSIALSNAKLVVFKGIFIFLPV